MIAFTRKIVESLEKWSGLPFKRLIKFGLVGSSGVIVNMGFFYLFNELFLIIYQISSLIAIEISIINNFIWNNLWTWKDRATDNTKKQKIRFLKYNLISWISASLSYGILLASVEILGWNKYVGNLTGILCGMGFNFILNHFWTFKKHDI